MYAEHYYMIIICITNITNMLHILTTFLLHYLTGMEDDWWLDQHCPVCNCSAVLQCCQPWSLQHNLQNIHKFIRDKLTLCHNKSIVIWIYCMDIIIAPCISLRLIKMNIFWWYDFPHRFVLSNLTCSCNVQCPCYSV